MRYLINQITGDLRKEASTPEATPEDADKVLQGTGQWGHKLQFDAVIQNGKYGYINGDDEFVPFKSQADIDAAVAAAKVGTATAAVVVKGYTFTNDSESGIVGTFEGQEKTVTSSTSAQTVTPDSGKYLTKVTINAISPLRTSNSMIVPRWGTGAGSNVPATQIATRNARIDFGNSNTYGNVECVEITMPEGYYAWSYGNSSCCIPTETKTVTAGTSASTITPTEYNTNGKYVKFLKSVTVNPTPSQEKTITGSRSAQTVTPDSGKLLSKVTVNKYPDASGTYTTNTRGTAVDMGATNNYRYVNTNGVSNTNSGTYTFGSNTGTTVDLGETNTYRYADATNVYAQAKKDLKSWLRMDSGYSVGDPLIAPSPSGTSTSISGSTTYYDYRITLGKSYNYSYTTTSACCSISYCIIFEGNVSTSIHVYMNNTKLGMVARANCKISNITTNAGTVLTVYQGGLSTVYPARANDNSDILHFYTTYNTPKVRFIGILEDKYYS